MVVTGSEWIHPEPVQVEYQSRTIAWTKWPVFVQSVVHHGCRAVNHASHVEVHVTFKRLQFTQIVRRQRPCRAAVQLVRKFWQKVSSSQLHTDSQNG